MTGNPTNTLWSRLAKCELWVFRPITEVKFLTLFRAADHSGWDSILGAFGKGLRNIPQSLPEIIPCESPQGLSTSTTCALPTFGCKRAPTHRLRGLKKLRFPGFLDVAHGVVRATALEDPRAGCKARIWRRG